MRGVVYYLVLGGSSMQGLVRLFEFMELTPFKVVKAVPTGHDCELCSEKGAAWVVRDAEGKERYICPMCLLRKYVTPKIRVPKIKEAVISSLSNCIVCGNLAEYEYKVATDKGDRVVHVCAKCDKLGA